MTRGCVSLLAVFGLAVAGCAPVLLEKGPISTIDVARHAQKPSLDCSARWSPSSGLVIRVAKRTDVVLLRTARFHTIEWTGNWVGWAEPLELISSPVMLVAYGGLVAAGVFPPETADVKAPLGSKFLMATASLNPAVTLLGARLERRRTLGDDLFADPPSELRYAIHQPVRNLGVRYRILDPDGRPLAAGEARTDESGEAHIRAVPVHPAAVVVELPGREERLVP